MAVTDSIQHQIQSGEFTSALDSLGDAIKVDPENTELLYMAAVCHRYLKNYKLALADLEKLQQLSPENGRAFQEQGHVYRDQGLPDRALESYGLACRFNPALLASWQARLKILISTRQQGEAEIVHAQLAYLSALPRPLIAVTDLLSEGKLLKAEELCRKFLQKVPHHIEAMRLLADIGIRLGVMDDAEFLLESAVALDPGHVQARIDYIQVLRKRQKFQLALSEAKALLKTAPDNLQFRSLYAIESMQTGDYVEALDQFEQILQKLPGDTVTLTSRGHALKTIGRFDDAVESYRSALKSQPGHGDAWYSLANLKTYRFREAEVLEMQQQLETSRLPYQDRVFLNFALGKAFEDESNFELAFSYLKAGNYLKKIQSRYSAEQMHNEFEAQKLVCNIELLSRRHEAGFGSPEPIFVVGLPRAGSTLIEQILSSHSQVDGTLELPNILSLTHRLRRGDTADNKRHYPENLGDLSSDKLKEFGERYIKDTAIHRQGAPRFIDKMPNNFRHIGLIKLILPNAKIIDARRNPMACCFSGFRQLFAEGQEFTYTLEDIGHYYRDYVDLMDHWHQVLPGEILTVQHEDVVDDLEGSVRRLLDYCELAFEPACVNYHETERSIRTPSSEQVRQPIFRSGLDAWQQFEPWLDPLKNALGEDLRKQYDIR